MSIWLGHKLNEDQLTRLSKNVWPYEIVQASESVESVLQRNSRDPAIANCEIAFGQPDVRDVIETKSLEWIALTTAGYTRYDNDEVRQALAERGAQLTNASSVYSEPTAQHLLLMMLAVSRQLPVAISDQLSHHQWNQKSIRPECRLLDSSTVVLIVGFGAIGQRLTELLRPFHVSPIGFRRRHGRYGSITTLPIEQLDAMLPIADHVINVLPASDSSMNFFDRARFSRFKAGSFFYNIGRGETVDQAALLQALDANIGYACLDVTTPEPLPPQHPLWNHPRCLITPHTGGGMPNEIDRHIELFIENLSRFRCREPLVNRVM